MSLVLKNIEESKDVELKLNYIYTMVCKSLNGLANLFN